jgi:hypothetical protein
VNNEKTKTLIIHQRKSIAQFQYKKMIGIRKSREKIKMVSQKKVGKT